MKVKYFIIMSILAVVFVFLILCLCVTIANAVRDIRLEGRLEGIKIGRSLIGE